MAKRIIRGLKGPQIVETEVEIDPVKEEERQVRIAARERMKKESASQAALNDPELMRVWGECHSNWDDINQFLWVAFDSMLDLDPWTTRAIFFAPENDTAGRKMVAELVTQKLRWRPNDKLLTDLKRAMARIPSKGAKRNDLIHGAWGWTGNMGKGEIEVARFAAKPQALDAILYKKKDLERVRDEMKHLRNDLAKAVVPLREAKMRRAQIRMAKEFQATQELFAAGL